MNGSNILLIILIVLVVALIAFTVHLILNIRKLENKYRRFMKGRDGISLEDRFIEKFDTLDGFDEGLADVRAQLAQIRGIEQKNFTKYGVVKYDAFEDVGGRLSFVLALLNEEDSGIVLNAIHSKDNCFLYLKEVVKGESYIMLSSEEIQALRNAKAYDSQAEVENIMSTGKPFGQIPVPSDMPSVPDIPDKPEKQNVPAASALTGTEDVAEALDSEDFLDEPDDPDLADLPDTVDGTGITDEIEELLKMDEEFSGNTDAGTHGLAETEEIDWLDD